MGGAGSMHWGMRTTYKLLARKPQERHRCRWENNFKVDLREIMCKVVDQVHVAQTNGGLVRTYRVVILYLDRLAHCHVPGSSDSLCKLGHCEYSTRKQNKL